MIKKEVAVSDIKKSLELDTPESLELTPAEVQSMLNEVLNQPQWRSESDKCAEYYDGNQYDSDTLQALSSIGMSPMIENLVSPTVNAITGLEAKTRKDWKVSAQSIGDYEQVAEALGQKLYEAEQQTFADRANSDAFKAAVVAGVGWIKVGRNGDPFKYPYTYEYVHRDEVFYDMKSTRPDYSDGNFFIRSRWYDLKVLTNAFPDKKALLEQLCNGWNSMDLYLDNDKLSEALQHSMDVQREFVVEGYEFYQTDRKRIRLNEIWYRRWVKGDVIKLPNGVVEEFDENNDEHINALADGASAVNANYTKIRVGFWAGMHKLSDSPNPFKHGEIPYVPVFGNVEDKTKIPYGEVRSMIPMQDEINARNTKLIWLLAGKRITMTEGVTIDDPEMVRQEAGRPDAMHILDPNKLREGGMFNVESDFALSNQQYQALVDKRNAIKNVSGVYAAFEGSSNNQSGVALHAATEQSSQTLANIYDNYEFSRSRAGNMLLSLIIEDMAETEEQVLVQSDYKPSKTVTLNKKNSDGTLTNSVNQARLKVALNDVPNTTTFKHQTLQYLTQITQGLPPAYQAVMVKFMIRMTDINSTDKQEIIELIAKANGEVVEKAPKTQEEAQQIEAMKQQAMQQQQMQMRAAQAELAIKEGQALKLKAEAEKLAAESKGESPESKAKIEEYEQMLLDAKDEFDTRRMEIEERKNTALEVARIQANAQIAIAKMRSEDAQTINRLQSEIDQIEQLLNSHPSDTGNKQLEQFS